MADKEDTPDPERDSPAQADAPSGNAAMDFEVPAFAKNFPTHPELRTLLRAFELGRYDVVRERAPKLAATTDDPEVARAAQELRRRLDADPLAVRLLLGVLALLALMTAWAYMHHQH